MATAPPSGKCVYCLRESDARAWNNVFPGAWYPDGAPADATKHQVPACPSCCNEYDRLERELLVRLGLSIDPKTASASGIVPDVLRALDPRYARNEKERRARHALRDEAFRGSHGGRHGAQSAPFAGFGGTRGGPPEKPGAVAVEAKSLHRLAEKLVRGIVYLENKSFLERPGGVRVFAVQDEAASPFVSLLDKSGSAYAGEPGIAVRRAAPGGDDKSSPFSIEIWSTIKLVAVAGAQVADTRPAKKAQAEPAATAAPARKAGARPAAAKAPGAKPAKKARAEPATGAKSGIGGWLRKLTKR
jgi:hypothetical protein